MSQEQWAAEMEAACQRLIASVERARSRLLPGEADALIALHQRTAAAARQKAKGAHGNG